MNRTFSIGIFFILSLAIMSCDNNVITPNPTNENPTTGLDTSQLHGTGNFSFSSYEPLANKPIEVYYHVPANATNQTPILFVFHGAGRDGSDSRTALIEEANAFNFIVIAPEFSEANYPDGDAYNLGNIFIDGDNPSASTLNDDAIWSFSSIEPLFDLIKFRIGSAVDTYDMFGHSAGAQFVHRFLIYKPQARVNKAVAAASGWYTMLDDKITFPYGTKSSPAEAKSHNGLLAKQVHIIVGEADTDPNSFGLRHNSEVDKQGLNRYERAQYFYNKTQLYAVAESTPFNWQYKSLPKVGHDFDATSAAGALLLYK